MHFRSKAPAAYPSHRPTRQDTAARVPSTAWLAAQEAFSALPPVTAEPAVVTVRKTWNPSGDADTGAASAAETPLRSDRPARVFLVASETSPITRPITRPTTSPSTDATTGPAAAAAPRLAVVPQGEAAGPEQALAPAAEARRAQRPRRRRHADQLPGPVVLITQPRPEQAQRPLAPQAPQLPSLSTAEQLQALKAAMAQLNAVFDDIQRASALRFLD